MKKAIVTLRNPADGKTFVKSYKVKITCKAWQVAEMARRDFPRCIVIKMAMKV